MCEGQLKRIFPRIRTDVYVLSKPIVRFAGVVDSVGFGVTPEPNVIGRLEPGKGRASSRNEYRGNYCHSYHDVSLSGWITTITMGRWVS